MLYARRRWRDTYIVQTNEPSGERWVTVAQAVQETSIPERTIYRWIKAKRLPARSSDGTRVVEVGAVRALAASRPATGGAVAAGRIVGGGRAADGDPQTDSLILARLDQGDRPLDLVRDLQIAPQRVRALAEELAKLKAMEKGPTVAEQLGALQDVQDQHGAKISSLMEAVGELFAMLEDLKGRLAALPFPPNRSSYTCGRCGASGLYVVPLRCSCCNLEQAFGFSLQKPN